MRCLSRIIILISILLFTFQTATAASKGTSHISGNIISLSEHPLNNAIIKICREMKQGERIPPELDGVAVDVQIQAPLKAQS